MEENISASWDSLFCEFSTTQNLIESALITRSNGNHWRLILNPQMSIHACFDIGKLFGIGTTFNLSVLFFLIFKRPYLAAFEGNDM